MAMVDVDGSIHLSVDSQTKSVGLVWGLAATRRSVCIHQMNRVNSCSNHGHEDSTINIVVDYYIIIIIIIIIKDVLPNINCTQAAEGWKMPFFVPGNLDLWSSPLNSSERGTKHIFRVNLAQIHSAVPEIFHIQTEWWH